MHMGSLTTTYHKGQPYYQAILEKLDEVWVGASVSIFEQKVCSLWFYIIASGKSGQKKKQRSQLDSDK